MKNVIGLFTAMLMAAGLLAVTAPSASAAACTSYSGCVDTSTKASARKVVAKRRKATVCGKVSAVASNATPRGELRFTVKRNRGKFNFRKTVPYDGGKMCVVTKKLKKKGRYKATVVFVPLKGSIFNPSKGSTRFRVVR